MNRKERRKLRKDKNLIKELYFIIVKYLPGLLNMFENLTDTRNQNYVTYKMKTICVTRLFGLLCGLTTMTDISSDDFNSDNFIKNLSSIFIILIIFTVKKNFFEKNNIILEYNFTINMHFYQYYTFYCFYF